MAKSWCCSIAYSRAYLLCRPVAQSHPKNSILKNTTLYSTALNITFLLRRYGLLCLLLCWAACAQEGPPLPERSSEFVAAYRQGLDLLERYKLRAAENAFVRCVALDSAAYEGHWQLGRLRLLQGRIDEGVHSLQEALVRAPELTAARALTLFAAREKDSDRRCDIEAGMAKLLAARVAWAAADDVLQIHGGNGFALEYPITRVLWDARILNIFEGAGEIQAGVIARGLLTPGRN